MCRSLVRGLPLSGIEGWRASEVSWSLNRGLPLTRIEGLPASYAKWVSLGKILNSLEYLTKRFNKIFNPRDPAIPAFMRK